MAYDVRWLGKAAILGGRSLTAGSRDAFLCLIFFNFSESVLLLPETIEKF